MMRVSSVVLTIALLSLVSALPAESSPATSPWNVVIERTNGYSVLPGLDGPLALDSRTSIRNVSIADLGDHIGIRLTTYARTGDPEIEQSITSKLTFTTCSFHCFDVHVSATDTMFTVTTEAIMQGVGLLPIIDPNHVSVVAGSTAWAYEIHVWRGAFTIGGQYRGGENLRYFEASVVGDQMGQSSASQNKWGEAVTMRSGGGYPPDAFAPHTQEPWYSYNIRAHTGGDRSSLATAPDGTVHFAYRLATSAYYNRQLDTLGIYHIELQHGQMLESFVSAAKPGGKPTEGGPHSQLALAILDGQPHIFFHAEPALGIQDAADALVHAWRDDSGSWHTERPLVGLGLGGIYVDQRSALDATAGAGRLVVAVRPADRSAVILVEKQGMEWRALHAFPAADFVRLRQDAQGSLHAAVYLHTDIGNEERKIIGQGRLAYARESYQWELQDVIPALADGDSNPDWMGGFDMALRADGLPCFFYAPNAARGGAGAEYQCGGSDPETIMFLSEAGRPLRTVRLELGSDGSAAVVAGFQGYEWFGSRATDGIWWWEAKEFQNGPNLATLPDGRAVIAYNVNGGYGGINLDVQHPRALDDRTRAYFVGPAADSWKPLEPYRAGGVRSANASEAPDVANPVAVEVLDPTSSAENQREASAIAPPLALLVVALAAIRRRAPATIIPAKDR